jgi:hypothetical protein
VLVWRRFVACPIRCLAPDRTYLARIVTGCRTNVTPRGGGATRERFRVARRRTRERRLAGGGGDGQAAFERLAGAIERRDVPGDHELQVGKERDGLDLERDLFRTVSPGKQHDPSC